MSHVIRQRERTRIGRCRGIGPWFCQQGFSLLEILVAFSILALSLGVLMQIFGKGMQMASASGSYTEAMLVAESLLAAVGVSEPLEEGEQSGDLDDRYRWSVQVMPHEFADAEIDLENLAFRVYHVRVDVGWDNRSVRLQTLRIGPRDDLPEL